jgi:hypothetical protein
MRRSLVLVVVIGATLAACGGGGAGGDAITASAIARDTTAGGSARVAMTSTPSGAGGHVTSTMNGVTDFRHEAGELTNTLSDTATWTIRWVGGHVYLRSTVAPGSEKPVPSFFESGTWYRMDDTTDDQTSAAAFTHVFRPDFLLDALRSSARSVRAMGSDRIRDVPTTHLQLVVDNAAMERKLGNGATVTTEEGQDAPPPTQTVDVWVDGRHRLRRVSVVETETESDTPTEAVSTMDFYDYGVPVDVQPPPANEITDFPNFDRLATSSAASAPPTP